MKPKWLRVGDMLERINQLAPGRWPALYPIVQNSAAWFPIQTAEWRLKVAGEQEFDSALADVEKAWTRATLSALGRVR
jgi:hypothetical protein